MICNLYKAKIKHDSGTINLSITASSEDNAKELICKAENCPVSAIIEIELIKCIYNNEVNKDNA